MVESKNPTYEYVGVPTYSGWIKKISSTDNQEFAIYPAIFVDCNIGVKVKFSQFYGPALLAKLVSQIDENRIHHFALEVVRKDKTET